MTTSYLDSKRISGTTADREGTPAVSGGWKELARTTLGSAGEDITVSSLADKRYLMILTYADPASGDGQLRFRFNSDSGSNYARRYSINGASDSTSPSNTQAPISDGLGGNSGFAVSYVANKSDKEKLVLSQCCEQNTAGAGNAPNRYESTPKWANTSAVINAVGMHNTSGVDFSTGGEVVVLGWDDSDTHTTNFWEELVTVDNSTPASSMSTGTFTAKKYLWIQGWFSVSTSAALQMQFNNDTAANYSLTRSINGAADATNINKTEASLGATDALPKFINFFMINNSANEKLTILHSVEQQTAGAGTAPDRYEGCNKWSNTSAQVTEIDFLASTGNISRGIFKVWGSN